MLKLIKRGAIYDVIVVGTGNETAFLVEPAFIAVGNYGTCFGTVLHYQQSLRVALTNI